MQKNRTYTVNSKNGIDSTKATKIVNFTFAFKSNINFKVSNKISDAKSLINLMALNIKQGDELEVIVIGEDSSEAIDSVEKLLRDIKVI